MRARDDLPNTYYPFGLFVLEEQPTGALKHFQQRCQNCHRTHRDGGKPNANGRVGMVIQMHRDMGAGLLVAGKEAEALGHLRAALAVADNVIQRAPGSLYMQRSRADVYESLGRYYQALAHRRPEHKPEAHAWLQKSLDMRHDWVRRDIATALRRVQGATGSRSHRVDRQNITFTVLSGIASAVDENILIKAW